MPAAKLFSGADEEAVALYRRSIELYCNYPISHLYLAAALQLLGRTDEAKKEASASAQSEIHAPALPRRRTERQPHLPEAARAHHRGPARRGNSRLCALLFGAGAIASSALVNLWRQAPSRRGLVLRRHSQSKLVGLMEHLVSILWAVAAVIGSWAVLVPLAAVAAVLAIKWKWAAIASPARS